MVLIFLVKNSRYSTPIIITASAPACDPSESSHTHRQREHGAAEQAHDHQARYFVLLIGHVQQRLREDDRENVRVAEAEQRDADRDHRFVVREEKPGEGDDHHQHADQKERPGRETSQQECAGEAPDRTEQKIDACRVGGLLDADAQTLLQYLRSRQVHADVDTHVANDSQKGEQHESVAQQREALPERGGFSLLVLLLDLRYAERQHGQN